MQFLHTSQHSIAFLQTKPFFSELLLVPALLADGKVCLSLLGTWHGGDESEKWRPGTSNLFQASAL